MKRFCLLSVFILLLLLCSCNEEAAQPANQSASFQQGSSETIENVTEEKDVALHQNLLKTSLERKFLDAEVGQTLGFAEIGLMDVRAYEKVEINSDTSGQVFYAYVLGDFYHGENDQLRDSYLAVETGRKIIFYDFGITDFDTKLFAKDFDGDDLNELLVCQAYGASGGAGQYGFWVFDLIGDEVIEQFHSEGEQCCETGFQSEFLPGKMLKITNAYTGYETVLDLSEYYADEAFDEKGLCTIPSQLFCDSFYEINPINADDDAAFELECFQYASIGGHANGVGVCKTVLKYSNEAQKFDVIQSEFQTDLPKK